MDTNQPQQQQHVQPPVEQSAIPTTTTAIVASDKSSLIQQQHLVDNINEPNQEQSNKQDDDPPGDHVTETNAASDISKLNAPGQQQQVHSTHIPTNDKTIGKEKQEQKEEEEEESKNDNIIDATLTATNEDISESHPASTINEKQTDCPTDSILKSDNVKDIKESDSKTLQLQSTSLTPIDPTEPNNTTIEFESAASKDQLTDNNNSDKQQQQDKNELTDLSKSASIADATTVTPTPTPVSNSSITTCDMSKSSVHIPQQQQQQQPHSSEQLQSVSSGHVSSTDVKHDDDKQAELEQSEPEQVDNKLQLQSDKSKINQQEVEQADKDQVRSIREIDSTQPISQVSSIPTTPSSTVVIETEPTAGSKIPETSTCQDLTVATTTTTTTTGEHQIPQPMQIDETGSSKQSNEELNTQTESGEPQQEETVSESMDNNNEIENKQSKEDNEKVEQESTDLDNKQTSTAATPMEIEKPSNSDEDNSTTTTDSSSSVDSSPSKKRPVSTNSTDDLSNSSNETETSERSLKRQKVGEIKENESTALDDKEKKKEEEIPMTSKTASKEVITSVKKQSVEQQTSNNTNKQESLSNNTNPNSTGIASGVRRVAIRSGPIGLPLLRSSPVDSSGRTNVNRSITTSTTTTTDSSNSNENKNKIKKKRKSVSWADENKLTETHFIDTRVELVKSWDPDFLRVTLPFSPATFQIFHTIVKNQESGEDENNDAFLPPSSSTISTSTSTATNDEINPELKQHDSNNEFPLIEKDQDLQTSMISTFEESRKKEHDMELERTKQAREELKHKLNSMNPKRKWVRPKLIILPTECEIESKNIISFNVIDDNYKQLLDNNNSSINKISPGSPPSEWAWMDDGDVSDVHVRVFQLSDDNLGEDDQNQQNTRNGRNNPQNHSEMSIDTFDIRSDRAHIPFYYNGINTNGTMSHPGLLPNGSIPNNGGLGLGLRSIALPNAPNGTNINNGNNSNNIGGGLRPNPNEPNNTGGQEFGNFNDSNGTSTSNITNNNTSGLTTGLRGGALPQNVRQLLSALQTSGVLKMSNRSGNNNNNNNNNTNNNVINATNAVDHTSQMDGQVPSGVYNRRNMMGMGNAGTGEDEFGGIEDGMNGSLNGRIANGLGPRMTGNDGSSGTASENGSNFAGNGAPGIMDGFSFPIGGVPPVGHGVMGMPPNMMHMGGMGIPMSGMNMAPNMMPPMGMGLNGGNNNPSDSNNNNSNNNKNKNNNSNNNNNNNSSINKGNNSKGNSNNNNNGNNNKNNNSNSNNNNSNNNNNRIGLPRGGRNGRHVETITRPKLKSSKPRKKCKFFGSKQGCRDGASCMYSHN